MNQNITCAISMLICSCVAAWGGYDLGKRNIEVSIRTNPLIESTCIPISTFEPTNRTFGATTLQFKLLAKQYDSLYSAACVKVP